MHETLPTSLPVNVVEGKEITDRTIVGITGTVVVRDVQGVDGIAVILREEEVEGGILGLRVRMKAVEGEAGVTEVMRMRLG